MSMVFILGSFHLPYFSFTKSSIAYQEVGVKGNVGSFENIFEIFLSDGI